ncbi:MAG: hypothetical protein ICV87_13690, partial [Gemmatimonadetes bacterium]|nr:hypothetical protein [Gemmatimonadota bacterium]
MMLPMRPATPGAPAPPRSSPARTALLLAVLAALAGARPCPAQSAGEEVVLPRDHWVMGALRRLEAGGIAAPPGAQRSWT